MGIKPKSSQPLGNSDGFVVVTALVAMSVMILLMLSFYTSLRTSAVETERFAQLLDRDDLAAWISETVASADVCRYNLASGNSSPTFNLNDPTSRVSLNAIYMGTTGVSLKVAEQGQVVSRYSSSLQVDRISVGNLICTESDPALCDPAPGLKKLGAKLKVETSAEGRALKPVEIDFQLVLNSSNPAAATVSDCALQAEVDTAAICTALNMSYDPATDLCTGGAGRTGAAPPPRPNFRYMVTAAPGSFGNPSGECDAVSPAPPEYSMVNKTRIYRGFISICFWRAPL